MRDVNAETRGVDASTDVLSFCFSDDFVEPGVLGEVPLHGRYIGDYYCLGEMLISVDYVRRRCVEDRKAADDDDERKGRAGSEMVEGEVVGEEATTDGTQDDDDDGYEYEYIEVEVDEYDDRGVAPAMLKVYNPEIRLHMLIVHGMLHLVGYDHIEDDDYELMVVREDEVMAELKKRLGDDFGVAVSLPAGGAEK